MLKVDLAWHIIPNIVFGKELSYNSLLKNLGFDYYYIIESYFELYKMKYNKFIKVLFCLVANFDELDIYLYKS